MSWLPYTEFPNHYEVSDRGYVRSLKTGRVLQGSLRKGGYRIVCLSIDGKQEWRLVHLMVLITFVGERPEGLEALHGSDGVSNNSLSNLKWGTRLENMSTVVNANSTKTECAQGHEYDEGNTYWYMKDGYRCRGCRACARTRAKAHADKIPVEERQARVVRYRPRKLELQRKRRAQTKSKEPHA